MAASASGEHVRFCENISLSSVRGTIKIKLYFHDLPTLAKE